MNEDFKERITRNASNKHIFDPIKREKWTSLEDRVTLTKIKIYGNMKHIVEQKIYPWFTCSKIKSQ